MEFAPHGHTLAVASDSDVILWDVTDRIHPRRVGSLANAGSVEAVAFAADGRFLAIGNFDFHVALWDLSDPRHPQRLDDALTGFEWAVTALAFTRNGGLLAAGSVDHITPFDISDPSQPNRLGQPLRGRGDVTALAFTANGNTLVTGGRNGFDLWDFTDRSHPRLLGQPPLWRLGEVDALALAADGHTVATAGKADRTVTLWDLTPLEALRSNSVEEACIRAGGPLDTAMWNIYAPGLRYQNTCRS